MGERESGKRAMHSSQNTGLGISKISIRSKEKEQKERKKKRGKEGKVDKRKNAVLCHPQQRAYLSSVEASDSGKSATINE